jgi:hypothetical protein
MLRDNESGMKEMSFESWFYFQIRNTDRGFSTTVIGIRFISIDSGTPDSPKISTDKLQV